MAVAHPVPDRGSLPARLGLRFRSLDLLGGFGRFKAGDLVEKLDVLAVDVEAALLEQQPVVEAGMHAAGADLLAPQVGDAIDPGVGPYHELRLHGGQGLPEID